MKGILTLVMVAMAVITPISEDNSLTYVSGRVIDDSLAYMEEDVLWVPFRAVSEALGADAIIWDPAERTGEAVMGDTSVLVREGAPYIRCSGRYFYVPGGCRLEKDRFMVPADALCAALGGSIDLDGDNGTLWVTPGNSPILSGSEFYDETDLYWMSRIIEAEAGVEPFLGKIAVGSVVMNRVSDSAYPSTVKGVIFDNRSGIQFSPAYSGGIYCTPSADSVIAAKIALEGTDVTGGSLFFAMDDIAATCWAGRNRQYVTQIGRHVFFA